MPHSPSWAPWRPPNGETPRKGPHRAPAVGRRRPRATLASVMEIRRLPLVSIAGLGILVACATNPATGRKQLMLVSESQEASMGKEADEQFHALYGDFED